MEKLKAKKWKKLVMERLNNPPIWGQFCNCEPLTPAQQRKQEKEYLAREKAEKKRRAKKITMTVGELEDKLEAERDYDY